MDLKFLTSASFIKKFTKYLALGLSIYILLINFYLAGGAFLKKGPSSVWAEEEATYEGPGCNGNRSVWGVWTQDGTTLVQLKENYGVKPGECNNPVYEPDPASNPAPSQKTETYRGAGCIDENNPHSGNQSVWEVLYSDGTRDIIQNFGAKAGECGNSYPQPSQVDSSIYSNYNYVSTTYQPQSNPIINGSCNPNTTSTRITQNGASDTITWSASASGGNGNSLRYSWFGDEIDGRTGNQIQVHYNNPGVRSAGVVISDGTQSITIYCNNQVNVAPQIINSGQSYQPQATIYYQPTYSTNSVITSQGSPSINQITNASCSPSATSTRIGQNGLSDTIFWTALASGGNGGFNYQWFGDQIDGRSGNQMSVQYNSAGVRSAGVVISDGRQSVTVSCSSQVNVAPSPVIAQPQQTNTFIPTSSSQTFISGSPNNSNTVIQTAVPSSTTSSNSVGQSVLNASCQANLVNPRKNLDSVTFTGIPSGSNLSNNYSYTWTGDVIASGSSVSTVFNSAGRKNAEVRIHDNSGLAHDAYAMCSVIVSEDGTTLSSNTTNNPSIVITGLDSTQNPTITPSPNTTSNTVSVTCPLGTTSAGQNSAGQTICQTTTIASSANDQKAYVIAQQPTSITELPKTGLPIAGLVLGGLFPIGAVIKKRFGLSSKEPFNAEDIWLQRQFKA